jgi:ferrochelatase
VGGLDWEFAFQSAGFTAEPWLGPAIEERLPALAAAGYTHVVAQPLGFVCDHIEILYDLDIEAAAIAAGCGLAFSRTASMNTGETFLRALADAVESPLREMTA